MEDHVQIDSLSVYTDHPYRYIELTGKCNWDDEHGIAVSIDRNLEISKVDNIG